MSISPFDDSDSLNISVICTALKDQRVDAGKMLVEGRTVKSPDVGRGFLLSLDGITIYNLWKVVIANCENESYNLLKGPSIPAFTYRDGCLFDLSIPSEDDMGTMTCGCPIESDIRSQ